MASDFSYLRDHYPQEVTSDQVRQMLHISKRKCAWMLQNGWIRCEDNGKSTATWMPPAPSNAPWSSTKPWGRGNKQKGLTARSAPLPIVSTNRDL